MQTFLQLVDDVGLEPSHVVDPATGEEIEHPKAGELAPLCRQGLPVPVPEVADGEFVTTVKPIDIEPAPEISAISLVPARIIPGTRIIETTSDQIAAAILQLGVYRVCDPPKTSARTRAKAPTKKELEAKATSLGIETTGLTAKKIAAAIDEHQAAPPEADSTQEQGGDAATGDTDNEEG